MQNSEILKSYFSMSESAQIFGIMNTGMRCDTDVPESDLHNNQRFQTIKEM